jgi:hypothetical protein
MRITNIRILPPLAIARLGSSPRPLANYDLELPSPVAPHKIVPATTLDVDDKGNLSQQSGLEPVQFRDSDGLIRPVAPFFEIWAQVDFLDEWVPLTKALLKENGLRPNMIRWFVKVANHKLFRRTRDPRDRIETDMSAFSDHDKHPLWGRCANFLDGEKLPLGWVQYIRPSQQDPEIRLRFTPAHGNVYGTKSEVQDAVVVRAIYDPEKGGWGRYVEPENPSNNCSDRGHTNPSQTFAGYSKDDYLHSYGYIDDECDGIIEASLETGGKALSSFARVTAGPPTFAPDSKPIRSVADEIEQALLGPDVEVTWGEVAKVWYLVRHALETVRLMNTDQLNKPGKTGNVPSAQKTPGAGMARRDSLDFGRKTEPIFDTEVVDAAAIRARHERVLVGLESGSLAWFARVLREYDQVGDLTDEGRRKMPGMMRNSDGRHLALTRRQVSRVRAVAELISSCQHRPSAEFRISEPDIRPLNLAAQLEYRAKGNPPNTQPDSAIANAYPGLEMDFRNAWRRIFKGIVLHESLNLVLEVEWAEFEALKGMQLMRVAGIDVTAPVKGPNQQDGQIGPLKDSFGSDRMALEWSNALASVMQGFAGRSVTCDFQSLDGTENLTKDLNVRFFFERDSAVIARDIAEPGALTQSLCAPWQIDYRECACFYWAANRPDFVNVEIKPDGSSAGNNWMQKDRTDITPKVYINDDWLDERLLSHIDLLRDWEKALRFVIANEDEPPVVK